ncbi:hypothetical protein GSI_06242 [Ganoderma sinense ZZ0214-1]|uniref:Uncharacterized protein n=1 Tax=Ganoderma sinense ZZ0214-1 TaxID=1077348 RepID=A0A2G8SCP9_9APHY|nr:hypothetical protein GSI_06242 [Ganoderma sinense ZZ0214-1]
MAMGDADPFIMDGVSSPPPSCPFSRAVLSNRVRKSCAETPSCACCCFAAREAALTGSSSIEVDCSSEGSSSCPGASGPHALLNSCGGNMNRTGMNDRRNFSIARRSWGPNCCGEWSR